MWGRFGSHRYGGRFAERVPDCVQDCYVNLLREGGLRRFVPPEDGAQRLGRFRGWLWSFVNHFCNETLRRVTLELPPPERPWCPPDPESAFMRQFSLTVVQSSIERVQRDWEQRGRAEKFRVLCGFVIGDGTTYEEVAARLALSVEHARVLVCELRRDLREALRREVGDGMDLRGLPAADAKRKIEREVDEIMSAWSGADGEPHDGHEM